MATNKKIQKSTKSHRPTKAVAKVTAKSAAKPLKKAAPSLKLVKKAQPVKKSASVSKISKQKQTVKSVSSPKKVASATKAASKVATQKITTTPLNKKESQSKATPVVLKVPSNQNPIAASAAQKTAPAVESNSSARPVYRPIQVINKSLAPLQPVRQMAPVTPAAEKVEFKKGDYVVYPAHGVGQIEAVESQTIAGMEIKLYAIVFEKDRMRLKVPVFKAQASGLRRLSNTNRMQDALKTLQGRAQIRRAMWSRRAQEYEMKINSGNPVAIAEVLRDLKRSNDDTEQSYSERQIYQSALERLAREVAAVEKISETEAAERLEGMIKGRRARSSSADKGDEAKKTGTDS